MVNEYALLMVGQVVLLALAWKVGALNSSKVLYKYGSPMAMLSMLYVVFYFPEQIVYTFGDEKFVGRGDILVSVSPADFLKAQLGLIEFLSAVVLGAAFTSGFLPRESGSRFESLFRIRNSNLEQAILKAFFIVGVAAIVYRGYTLDQTGGVRSALVKTNSGLVATTVSFFGNFAYSVMLFQFIRQGRYGAAAVLFAIFGVCIVFTGARGRLLFPTAIAVFTFFSYRNKLPKLKLTIVAVAGVVVLAVMDPLKAAFTDEYKHFSFEEISDSVVQIFEKRNFDAFSNFLLIYSREAIAPDLAYLVEGAREVFMRTYFPEVYNRGVALTATYPGYFYLAGGDGGFIVLSALYGAFLGLLNICLRKIGNFWIFYSYMFFTIGACFTSGEAFEGFDKVLVSASPGIILYIVSSYGLRFSSR